jgi:hypothetical protein
MRRTALASFSALVLSVAADARADGSATFEAGGGFYKPSATIQGSAQEYQKLGGRWDATDALSVSGAARLSHDFPAAPQEGSALRTGDDWVLALSLDAVYNPTPRLALGLGLNGSPPSSRDVVGTYVAPPGPGPAGTDALVRSVNQSIGAAVDVSYDTFAGDDEPSHTVDGTFDLYGSYTQYVTTQRISSLETNRGVVDAATLSSDCAGKTTRTCQAASAALVNATQTLGQFRAGATITGTLYERTDLSFDFAYYLYDRGALDDAGVFTVATQPDGAATYGAGFPTLPPRFTLRPEISHRWDLVGVRAFYQFSDYAVSDGSGHTVGGKVQLYLGKWRLYTTGSYRQDSFGGEPESSWTAGLGVTRTF